MVWRQYPDLIDPALIRAAVVEACGEEPRELVKRQQNRARVTYEAQLLRRTVFLKAELERPAEPYGLALEAWALRRAARAGLPVPKPLRMDCTRSRFPFSWLLLSAVPGVSLNEANLSRDREYVVLRQCGGLLYRLHQIKTAGFGPLEDTLYLERGRIRGMAKQWRAFVIGLARADAAQLVEARALSQSEADHCLDTVETAVPDLRQGFLVHGDFDRTHVYVDEDTARLTGIIDFGDRQSADPEWELSWLGLIDGDSYIEPVADGYRMAGGALDGDVLNAYAIVRLLWRTRRRHDSGQQGQMERERARLLARLST